MTTAIRRRRGTTAQHSTFIGLEGELTVDTDKDTAVVHDGSTQGGRPLLREDGSNSALSLGSAATPSLKFTGDTNTGIYSPGADQLAVATNGVERVKFGTGEVVFNDGGANYDFRIEGDTDANLVFVDASTNRVGIGTSSPGHTLDVSGASTILRLQSSNSNAYLRFDTTSVASALIGSQSGAMVFNPSTGEKLRITSAGNVGIGTTSPNELLEVAGNIHLSGADRSIFNRSNNALTFGTNNAERLRITSAGLVGIGTSSPTGTLHVNGSVVNTPLLKLAYTSLNNSNANILIPIDVAQDTTSGGTRTATTIKITDISSGGPIPGTKTLNGLHIDLSGSTYGIKNAALFEGGNVGIGTTSPGATLDLSGSFIQRNPSGNVSFSTIPVGIGNTTTFSLGTTDGSGNLLTGLSLEAAIPVPGVRGGIIRTTNTNAPALSLKTATTSSALISFDVNGSERARIDSSGRLLVGTSSARAGFFGAANFTPQLQLEGTGGVDRILSVTSSSTTTSRGAIVALAHQKSGTIGGQTTLADGDSLGILSYQGSDGSAFIEGAKIEALADGGVSTNDLPTRLVFSTTADGASSPTERMRITNTGLVTFAGATSSFPALKRNGAVLETRLADDSGFATASAQLRAQGTAPASTGATGTAGDIRYDADYIYVCTATNTWKRAALSTW